jgi:hypothetical protein
MKTGLVYIFGLIFALIVISSEQKNERVFFGAQSFQSIGINSNSDCVIPEFNNFLKNTLQKLNSYQLVSIELFVDNYNLKVDIVSIFQVLYQKKTFDIKCFIQRPFRLILYSSLDNTDSHILS